MTTGGAAEPAAAGDNQGPPDQNGTGSQQQRGSNGNQRGTPGNNNNNSTNKNKNKNKSKTNNSTGGNEKKYKGAEESLAVLGVKNDTFKADNFLVFQRSIENHVLAKFDHSGDIAYLVQEIEDPMPRLMKSMPTLRSLKKDYGINPDEDENKLSEEDCNMIKELQ